MAYQIPSPIDTLFTPQSNDGTAFTWRGSWVQGRIYYENEAVSYNYNGITSSYRATQTTTAIPALNPLSWEIISGITGQLGGGGNSNLINIEFAFGDASPKLIYTTLANQLILTCSVIITTPFNGSNVVMSVGDSIDNQRLITNNQIYLDEVGEYASNPCFRYTTVSDINLYINLGSGNTTGSGNVIIQI